MNLKIIKMQGIRIRFCTGDHKVFIETLKELKKSKIDPDQIFMPAYVQEIKEIYPIKQTRIPVFGLIGGIIGTLGGFYLQYWVGTVAYPLSFGGKPLVALPSFVPVMFECAILCSALFMVIAFLSKTAHKNSEEINDLISKDEYIIIITKDIDTIPEKINSFLLSGELNLIKLGC